MVRMIASKPLTYNTRRMRPGDEFDVRDNHAALFVSLNRASIVPAPLAAPQPAPQPAPPRRDDSADDLDALRATAQALGIPIDQRWGRKRLRTEIDKRRR